MTSASSLPSVAIVGRPNVGKSSLFNAIVGRRLAIVHEMSGVTRDRVAAAVSRGGRRFMLLDTGGLGMLTGESRKVDRWDNAIASQVEAAVETANVLVYVGDATAGVTPLDADIAKRLRASGKTVLCVANKCDDSDSRDAALDFTRLGFGHVHQVSCLNKGGLTALIEAIVAELPKCDNLEIVKPRVGIAVVGRPNVGKSSLVNALIGKERVVTSPIAGTTRDAIDVDFSFECKGENCPAVLVDTAGLRKTAKVDDVVEYFSVMRAKSAIERADLVIMVVEASADGTTAQDRRIAGLIQKAGKACVIAANKLDLLPGEKTAKLRDELYATLPGLKYAPVAFVSAKSRSGLDDLREKLATVTANLESEIPTGVLNRVLGDAVESNPPPVAGTSALKLFYTIMTGRNPHRFKLFVNRTETAAPHYLNYLKNQLRSAFELSGVAIELELKPRPQQVASIRRNQDKTDRHKNIVRRSRKK